MKTPQIVIGAVLGLVLLGGGFAAGMTLGRNEATKAAAATAAPSGGTSRFGAGASGAPGRGGLGQAAGGQQLLTGRVISVNDGSVTIEVRSGGAQGASPTVSSQIVFVGTATRIVKTAEQDIKASDLKANDQIQILATTDASGTVSASAMVVGGNALTQLFGGPGGTGGTRGASPSPSPTR